uniref:Uncharacterized protein n=1 Tax=Plectus sambesii TaxID=2011161 RepID=A0A914WQC7_9BILA
MAGAVETVLLRNGFIVIAFLATAVSAYSDAGNGLGLLFGLAINGIMAAIGYYAFDFQKTGVVLILLFGWCGCCCACAMDSRTVMKHRASQQQGWIIAQQQPVSNANPTVVMQPGVVVGQYAEIPLNASALPMNVDTAQFNELPPTYDVAVAANPLKNPEK